MDAVDYTDAGVRQMKGIRHLSNWQLIIPLLLLTSYTACDISTPSSVPELADSIKQSENLTTWTGQTASFTWAYEIQQFITVEWHFEKTPIAHTSKKSFSQDDITITPKYTHRFQLQTKGKVGFNLTDVTKSDTGTYSCFVDLNNTETLKTLNKVLQVIDPPETDGSTTTAISLASENIPNDTVAIAVIVPVLIIAIIAVTTS